MDNIIQNSKWHNTLLGRMFVSMGAYLHPFLYSVDTYSHLSHLVFWDKRGCTKAILYGQRLETDIFLFAITIILLITYTVCLVDAFHSIIPEIFVGNVADSSNEAMVSM